MADDPGKHISSVLFICGRNAVRSPMAACLARFIRPRDLYVASAGVVPGVRDPFVDIVLDEKGLDLGSHAPHSIDSLEDLSFDLLVTLSPEAHHAALELTRTNALDVEYWPTMDPTITTGSRQQILDAYCNVRDRLEIQIRQRIG